MTGLKGSSPLGKTEVTFPYASFKGDTGQFTTEVLGNADHIHVAANGPYITRVHKGLLTSRSSAGGRPGAPIESAGVDASRFFNRDFGFDHGPTRRRQAAPPPVNRSVGT